MSVHRTFEANERFGPSAVRSNVRRGLWQQPTRGVVVTHNAPLSTADVAEVALAVGAPRSALGGLAALRCDGFESPVRAPTDVVLPEGRDDHGPSWPATTSRPS